MGLARIRSLGGLGILSPESLSPQSIRKEQPMERVKLTVYIDKDYLDRYVEISKLSFETQDHESLKTLFATSVKKAYEKQKEKSS
jgi:DNA-binding protein YbaB